MPGPFHRRESDTQTIEVAASQVASGEIWGRTPQHGMCPTVQAYAGPIQPGQRGIQFETDTVPQNTGSPIEARWYLGITPGVQERHRNGELFASITADVTNHQPPWADQND